MQKETDGIRKIAANYIFVPGWPLVKNGYIEISGFQGVRVVDTHGQIKEIAGLEFYGGMIVPDYVCACKSLLLPEVEILPFLERLFAQKGNVYQRVALIEGADLIRLVWKERAAIRLL